MVLSDGRRFAGDSSTFFSRLGDFRAVYCEGESASAARMFMFSSPIEAERLLGDLEGVSVLISFSFLISDALRCVFLLVFRALEGEGVFVGVFEEVLAGDFVGVVIS